MRKASTVWPIVFLAGVAFGWFLFGNHEWKSQASAEMNNGQAPPIHHILLEVSNMQASLVFYQDMLMFRPESLGKTFSQLKGANVDIYLSTSPWGWKALRGKNEGLGLGMYPHFVVSNVQQVVAPLKKAGHTIVQEPREYGWGTEAFVADPDGYTWALISLPGK